MDEINLSTISKIYKPGLFKKKVRAVSDLSLTVNKGEVFGLIGPNGAGKSTTIRMLLGLIRPDFGTILFSDTSLDDSAIRSKIGYLPENPYLYDHLSLLELLDFCGKTSALHAEKIKSRGRELMTKLNLLDAQKRPLRTFSKGMLQRAGICFALLHDPEIVVLDEPMSGLDPIGRKMVFDLVMELKQQGKTIFFCSHILNDVERLCDRIGLIHQGRLIREFDRQDFLQKTGEMVFLKTKILPLEQQEQLEARGATFRDENNGHLLAIPGDSFFEINSYLEQAKIDITGCRSEWMTLEDVFMRTIEEQS